MAAPRKDTRRVRGELHEEREDMPIHEDIGRVVGSVLSTALNPQGGRAAAVRGQGQSAFRVGPEIEIVPSIGSDGSCPPGSRIAQDPCTGEIYCKKTRKRRKRLLTCSDKADIAFITGTLGKGALAQTAIASLLAKCG